ncbi:MAG: tRNA uridine-5-carboxymethylaminomethyl(34) synthesis GTPase MnmE [Acetanaerobacterium sp.]
MVMNMQSDTIAAIATGAGALGAGLGVVRISGDDALRAADGVFTSASGKGLAQARGYTARYGRVHDGEGDIDEAVALVFRAPKSYTGEDVVELSCHGGAYLLQRVLRAVLAQGAAPAGAGEFTKRAFLNGKMDLTQAQAVCGLIAASGEQAARAALSARDGALHREITELIARLVTLSSDLAAWIDFPEEDVPAVSGGGIAQTLDEVSARLDALLAAFGTGRIVREGIKTAIVGKPNVGKSTLMNLLAGKARSIVTDIPGTTRDVVEDTITLGGITLQLWDTAGLRETDDPVERIGVALAKKRLAGADLILAVFDSSQTLSAEDRMLIEGVGDTPGIAVINKTDLAPQLDREYIRRRFIRTVEISAATGSGADQLRDAIAALFEVNAFDPMRAVLADERQRDCAQRARTLLTEARDALVLSFDAVCSSIDCALDVLMELTGERASDTVINSVFERFCVGK